MLGLGIEPAFGVGVRSLGLIPLATRYSAGLIDYFFRGELQTAAPESNLYGMLTAYC